MRLALLASVLLISTFAQAAEFVPPIMVISGQGGRTTPETVEFKRDQEVPLCIARSTELPQADGESADQYEQRRKTLFVFCVTETFANDIGYEVTEGPPTDR